MKMHARVLSRVSYVRLFAPEWTEAHQAPLSLRFPRQEYRSGLPAPSPGDLPHPGIKLHLLHWLGASLPLSPLSRLTGTKYVRDQFTSLQGKQSHHTSHMDVVG